MTGIVKTDQLQGAQGTTVTVTSGHDLTVGTTNNNPTSSGVNVAGQSFTTTGGVRSTVDQNPAATFNRKTDDGQIVLLRKDGTTIGTTGSASSRLYIASTGNSGLKFRDDLSCIMPCNADGSNSDADQNLGQSGVRFQTLFLSGGVRLGGTGTANELDDYEEGTWTPAYITSGGSLPSITYNTQQGSYVKIGRLVVATFSIGTNGVSTIGGASGDLILGGLPFTHASGSVARSVSHLMGGRFASDTPAQSIVSPNTNYGVLREQFDTTTQANDLDVSNQNNRNVIEGHVIYYTS